jgi:hypothetical protein
MTRTVTHDTDSETDSQTQWDSRHRISMRNRRPPTKIDQIRDYKACNLTRLKQCLSHKCDEKQPVTSHSNRRCGSDKVKLVTDHHYQFSQVYTLWSARKGFELRAESHILQGEYVIEYKGKRLTENEGREHDINGGEEECYVFKFTDKHGTEIWIDASDESAGYGLARYINHDSNPNLEVYTINVLLPVSTSYFFNLPYITYNRLCRLNIYIMLLI